MSETCTIPAYCRDVGVDAFWNQSGFDSLHVSSNCWRYFVSGLQVTMNIDSNMMGSTIIEMFKNLSQEKKDELASQVILEWMKLPREVEVARYREQLVEKWKQKHEEWLQKNPGNSPAYNPYNDFENKYDFKRELESFKSTREEFLKEVIKEAQAAAIKTVSQTLKEDPVYQEALKTTFEDIKEKMPNLVQAAFQDYLKDQFLNMMTSGALALQTSYQPQNLVINALNNPNQQRHY